MNFLPRAHTGTLQKSIRLSTNRYFFRWLMRDLKSPSNLSKQKKTFHYSVDIGILGGGEYYMMKETLLCPTFDTLNSWHFEDCNEKKGQIQSFYDNEFDPFCLPKASFLKS